MLNVGIQGYFSTNWKSEVPMLKLAQSHREARSAAPLKMADRSRTTCGFSRGTNRRATDPAKGRKVMIESTNIAILLVFTAERFERHHQDHQRHGDDQKVILNQTILHAAQ